MRTFDGSTQAALPGRLTVSRRLYRRYFGDTRRERIIRDVACRLPWFMQGWPGIGTHIHHWNRICEVLEHGCLNPAVVLDANLGLVAVYTNLSNIERAPKPVVRIIQERLHLVEPEPPEDGAFLAAACVYWRTQPNAPKADWDDFSPIVVDCLADAAQSRAARERLKPMAWKALERAVSSLERRDQLGMYRAVVPRAIILNSF